MNVAGGVLTNADAVFVTGKRIALGVFKHIDDDTVVYRLDDLGNTTLAGSRLDSYKTCTFQFTDMKSNGAVGNTDHIRQVIHTQVVVFVDQFHDLDPSIGAKGFKYFRRLLQGVNTKHVVFLDIIISQRNEM